MTLLEFSDRQPSGLVEISYRGFAGGQIPDRGSSTRLARGLSLEGYTIKKRLSEDIQFGQPIHE